MMNLIFTVFTQQVYMAIYTSLAVAKALNSHIVYLFVFSNNFSQMTFEKTQNISYFFENSPKFLNFLRFIIPLSDSAGHATIFSSGLNKLKDVIFK